MLKSGKFIHNNKTYEIRADTDNNEVRVRLFQNDKLASPIAYRVTIETAFDAKMRPFPVDLVDGLMDLLKEETLSGRLKVV